jgi:D-psicose/D-tagatose/L-ribulose 3-epimerase
MCTRSSTNPLPFPLAVQITLPEAFHENTALRREMKQLQAMGIWGVEVNIATPSPRLWEQALSFLREYGLGVSMFASGLTGKSGGFSLSSFDEDFRSSSVAKVCEIASMIDSTDTGIILGYFKGPVVDDYELARQRFARSLYEISNNQESKTPILIEATNRYETSVANSCGEAESLLPPRDPRFSVLPDTFHMNIEEVNMFETLRSFSNRIRNLHLSDNNRFFPGFGSIDFKAVLNTLYEADYTGRVAIEGKLQDSLAEDLRRSVEHLRSCWKGISRRVRHG